MPAPPAYPNVLRITLRYGLLDALGSCRFYFTYTGGPPTNTNCDAIAAGVAASFGTDLASLLSSDSALNAVEIADLTSSSSGVGSYNTPVAGTRSGQPPQNDAAVLFNSIIQRRYRGGRPRMYQPFGVDADLESDRVTWDSTLVGECNTGWGNFKVALAALTGIGCTLVAHVNISLYEAFASVQNPVTKRWKNIPTPRGAAIAPDLIIATVARPEISQQRRRRLSTTP
jgi:hypothetical protein